MADLIAPGSPHTADATGVAYLVEEQANPSTDFFVLPALTGNGCRVVRCGFADLPSPGELRGAIVIFVRYVPVAWARLVEKARPSLRNLIFFMDDDVLDMGAAAGMPLLYRFKLARLAAWRLRWLRRQGAELWVASTYLQQKYEAWRPRLVLPMPIPSPVAGCRVFYHGSASHKAEILWLRPVVAEALRRDDQLFFEVVGGREVYRAYQNLPRVTVVHPMKWPAYQAFLAMPGRHIGLAPLLDVPFNRARSATKFFDITRCGAVGIYSPGGGCSEVVSHEQDGLIVPLDQGAWVKAVLHLARNPSLRQILLHNAEEKLAVLAGKAQESYAGLGELPPAKPVAY
jgi:hypothetical protein